jgi:tRNA (guanine-N7-)-methyltransferase
VIGLQGAPVPRPNHPYADAAVLPEGDTIDPRSLVGGGDAPVEIEIGPGRGGFMVERLEAVPTVRMVGFEVRLKWASIVDDRVRERFGHRGRVFAEDARRALPRLTSQSCSAVFVHFPDPWWKKRHEKRLVATSTLLTEVVRLLVPGGELFFQSDVASRAEQFEATVREEPRLLAAGDDGEAGARLLDNPYSARSHRERRAIADGLPVVRLRYRRSGAP